MPRSRCIEPFFQSRSCGFVFAWLSRGVAMASGCLALVGDSGCLSNKTAVPDDVDLHLPSPPVILEDQTHPVPGHVVIVDVANPTATFSAAVTTASAGPLVARWWVDRSRPCSPASLNCGEDSREQSVEATDGGRTRLLMPQMFRF